MAGAVILGVIVTQYKPIVQAVVWGMKTVCRTKLLIVGNGRPKRYVSSDLQQCMAFGFHEIRYRRFR